MNTDLKCSVFSVQFQVIKRFQDGKVPLPFSCGWFATWLRSASRAKSKEIRRAQTKLNLCAENSLRWCVFA